MYGPAKVNIRSYFYPLGNTPAVNWTRDIPRDQNVQVLSLGCGDVRNILFTCHCLDGKFVHSLNGVRRIANPICPQGNGDLDITSCDIEPTVIGKARNILVLSLILKQPNGTTLKNVWDIYYHYAIDKKAAKLLKDRSTELAQYAESLQTWHNSQFGSQLRVCDDDTLKSLRLALQHFANKPNEDIDVYIKDVKEMRVATNRTSAPTMTGIRSSAPIIQASITDLSTMHNHWWTHGTTDDVLTGSVMKLQWNPTFVSRLPDPATLHYASNPLLGFHLAGAYVSAQEVGQEPLDKCLKTSSNKAVLYARKVFQNWSRSFRSALSLGVALRFYIGDALALCHALHHNRSVNDIQMTSNAYRGPLGFAKGRLDGPDYIVADKAPVSFNVIDTSNLMDHMGTLNLLIACSSVLEQSVSATIYTESLVKDASNHKNQADRLLCGPLATVSTLLGLFATEYWTNLCPLPAVHEAAFQAISTPERGSRYSGQLECKLSWKRTYVGNTNYSVRSHPPCALKFDENALAGLVHNMYTQMFRNEDFASVFAQFLIGSRKGISNFISYDRAQLVELLCILQKQKYVNDWHSFVQKFCERLTDPVSRLFLEELFVYMHITGCYTVTKLSEQLEPSTTRGTQFLSGWPNIPNILCVTLQVPRKHLAVFKSVPEHRIGTPVVQAFLRPPPNSLLDSSDSLFTAVQVGFGDVEISGTRNTESCHVSINSGSDALAWTGKSSLVVAFLVPTSILFQRQEAPRVGILLGSTLQTSVSYAEHLGLGLELFDTALDDQEHVFLTSDWPNGAAYPATCLFSRDASENTASEITSDREVIVKLDDDTHDIKSFTARLNVQDEELKNLLSDTSTKVEVNTELPWKAQFKIGKKAVPGEFVFPLPISLRGNRTRIARKTSYIESDFQICLPVSDPSSQGFMSPIFLENHQPVLWNMPRLTPNKLPRLDKSRLSDSQWLGPHCTFMFSARERHIRERNLRQLKIALGDDARINLKESLFTIFVQWTGVENIGREVKAFGISNPSAGGTQILVFPARLLLDPANRSVVLDCAVLVLTSQLMPRLHRFLSALTNLGVCQITADDDELALWKSMLPAWVERCRDWPHKESCGYAREGKIPLSTAYGTTPLCACGTGKLPGYLDKQIPLWDSVKRYAHRATISPCFASPLVEQLIDADFVRRKMTELQPSLQPSLRPGLRPGLQSGLQHGLQSRQIEDEDMNLEACGNCGKPRRDDGGALLQCARCHGAAYCSKACQKAAWKRHKLFCEDGYVRFHASSAG